MMSSDSYNPTGAPGAATPIGAFGLGSPTPINPQTTPATPSLGQGTTTNGVFTPSDPNQFVNTSYVQNMGGLGGLSEYNGPMATMMAAGSYNPASAPSVQPQQISSYGAAPSANGSSSPLSSNLYQTLSHPSNSIGSQSFGQSSNGYSAAGAGYGGGSGGSGGPFPLEGKYGIVKMASGGITDLGQFDFMNKGMYPGSQIDRSFYSTPTQVPLGAQAAIADYDPATNPLTGQPVSRFAKGGIATLHYDGEDGSQVEDPTITEPAKPPTMAELAEQLNTYYRTDQNYDDLWKQFAATKEQDPTEWYKKQLGFLGQQQGWQIGQNRSDRLAGLQPQIDNTIAEAQAAGISDKEINSILNRSSLEGNAANQQRIATLSEVGGSGFNFSKDVRPGLLMVGGAALGAYGLDAALAAAAAEGTLAAGSTALPLAEITGSSFAGPAFALPEAVTAAGAGGGSMAAGADVFGGLAGTEGAYGGLTAAEQAASLTGATGGMGPTYAELGYLGANAPETAAAIAKADAAAKLAGAGGMTAKQLAAANMGLKTLSGAMGGASGQGGTYSTSGTPQLQTPSQQYIQPSMLAQQKYGELYRPYTYDYSTRRAAQGGVMYANGGGISTLGSYSDGGRLLKGPGDGMSDDIPASIGESQPAALADGEFVIPADVVSHLGNGSTDAGAKQLYKMMDKIRHARTGNKKQGKQINPDKFLPKG